MCVTDEQAHAAMEAYYAAFRFGKQDGVYYSEEERLEAMRSAIEAALALSHAAGQEAPTNPAEIGRKSVGGEAVIRHAWLHWLSKDDPEVEDDYEIHDTEQCPNQPCPDCIPVRIVLGHDTPARPPASAEVTVIDLGENGILHNAVVTGPVQVVAKRPEQVSGNMFQPHGGWQPIAIASSGRKGGGE